MTTDVTVYASRLQAYKSKQQGWHEVPKHAYHSTPHCIHLARTREVVSLHLISAAERYMEPCATCEAPPSPLLSPYEIEVAEEHATEEFLRAYEDAQQQIAQAHWEFVMWLQCIAHHGHYARLAWRGLPVPSSGSDDSERVVVSRFPKRRRTHPVEPYLVPQSGQRVRHVRFGTGKVTGVARKDDDAEVNVVFDNDYRERLMLASLARFEAIG